MAELGFLVLPKTVELEYQVLPEKAELDLEVLGPAIVVLATQVEADRSARLVAQATALLEPPVGLEAVELPWVTQVVRPPLERLGGQGMAVLEHSVLLEMAVLEHSVLLEMATLVGATYMRANQVAM
jgi:hypothetical protein